MYMIIMVSWIKGSVPIYLQYSVYTRIFPGWIYDFFLQNRNLNEVLKYLVACTLARVGRFSFLPPKAMNSAQWLKNLSEMIN